MSTETEVVIVVITGAVVVIALAIFVVLFLLINQKRKFLHLQEKALMKKEYDQELLRVQLEVQEQTFQDISSEIHDNVGQILAVVRLYLKGIPDENDREKAIQKISETDELVGRAINDLRHLSHSLNNERVAIEGLYACLLAEAERINHTGKMIARTESTGKPLELDAGKALILFRMCQEIISNAIRHAAADQIDIKLVNENSSMFIRISDNGKGFTQIHHQGNGFKNLHKRARLIDANLEITSEPQQGTTITIYLNKSQTT